MRSRTAGTAALVLVDDTTPPRAEPALFDEMLAGFRRQQVSRRLNSSLIAAGGALPVPTCARCGATGRPLDR